MAVGATEVEHPSHTPRQGDTQGRLGRADPRQRTHATVVEVKLPIGHDGVEIERPSRAHELFKLGQPAPLHRLQQDLVANRAGAAAEEPATALGGKAVPPADEAEIATGYESIGKDPYRISPVPRRP
jgi:hypothetical protein